LVEYHCGVERLAIGCGSAYACLAERTLALAQARRLQDAEGGHDRRIRRLVPALTDFLARGNRVVGSFGAANPGAAGRAVVEALRAADLHGLRVAVVHGDDVRDEVLEHDLELPEMGLRVGAVAGQIVSANAYIGAEPIVEALAADAQFVLGGRFADPSLFVGPSATSWAGRRTTGSAWGQRP
jgi:hypothetical protein